MADRVVFSVDLEPNKDDSMDGIREAMEWFDRTVPRGTVFATYRIADEMPDLLVELAESHEIGVHVHPREFGHDHDQLAELSRDRQRELIEQARGVITDAVGTEPLSFRAGRHSASRETLTMLKELGFEMDASINVRYTDYLPESLTSRREPFALESGLYEVPTSYGRPSLFSHLGLRLFPNRELTATANTLRTDRRGYSGLDALSWLRETVSDLSMYMHPYDATDHHANLENNGGVFRARVEKLLEPVNADAFVSSINLLEHNN
ncbi:hypothetical protein DVK02_04970 [Halobellus sp. Atlit-31R]|nr:hypothetical protein DVK02_04970 [Halobellus sp. Atlit-31R]